MNTLSHRSHLRASRSHSTRDLADHAPRQGFPWVNFNICPHCLAHQRPCLFESPKEWGAIISRSDGVNFHLIMCDRPIEYPAEGETGKAEMMSVAFWYVHEANGGSTETVILRRPHRRGIISLLRDLEKAADKLADKLRRESRLSRLYEFDGRQLRKLLGLKAEELKCLRSRTKS
jgi:hypothetical protein